MPMTLYHRGHRLEFTPFDGADQFVIDTPPSCELLPTRGELLLFVPGAAMTRWAMNPRDVYVAARDEKRGFTLIERVPYHLAESRILAGRQAHERAVSHAAKPDATQKPTTAYRDRRIARLKEMAASFAERKRSKVAV